MPVRHSGWRFSKLITPIWVLLIVGIATAFFRSEPGAEWADKGLRSFGIEQATAPAATTEKAHQTAPVATPPTNAAPRDRPAPSRPISNAQVVASASTKPTPARAASTSARMQAPASTAAPSPTARTAGALTTRPSQGNKPAPIFADAESGAALQGSGFPTSFDAAKRLSARKVYFDVEVDRYCGCRYDSNLRVDLSTCPMRTEQFKNRQENIEWEHVVPASDFGRQRACWRSPPQGTDGRTHCGRVDEAYRLMEADPHNLIPVIGALNAIRSNYRFGMVGVGTEDPIVSGCGFRVAREGGGRFVEPPDAVKGQIARIYFYFEDRYGHRIGRSQRRVFDAWNKQFPPDAAEIERDQRLAAITGVSNPFVVLY